MASSISFMGRTWSESYRPDHRKYAPGALVGVAREIGERAKAQRLEPARIQKLLQFVREKIPHGMAFHGLFERSFASHLLEVKVHCAHVVRNIQFPRGMTQKPASLDVNHTNPAFGTLTQHSRSIPEIECQQPIGMQMSPRCAQRAQKISILDL